MNNTIKRMIRGKNIIGLGSRRVVYDLGNGYVLKVARSPYGVANNRREVMIYRRASPEVKNHLGHILKHSGSYDWIIMKKYQTDFKKNKLNMRKLFAMRATFRRNGIIPFEIFSRFGPNYQNLRINEKGKIVVIDYGNFKLR